MKNLRNRFCFICNKRGDKKSKKCFEEVENEDEVRVILTYFRKEKLVIHVPELLCRSHALFMKRHRL